ncbi:S8 family serine peptidase [Aggregatilineales bacterium SYSU G02658]
MLAAEPDYFVSVQALATDPLISQQYSLAAMNIPLDLPDDLPSVTVAVIDSGICPHPELAGKVLGGYDFVENDSTPQDEAGHGCAVAGIIAANRDGVGMAGVAPNARLLAYRVLNAQGTGRYSSVASAIVRAADDGAQIINLSLGGANSSQILQDAVDYATSRGVLVIAAAGNNGSNTVLYPAAYPNVVSVGALSPDGTQAVFSNRGKVEAWAPGVNVLSLTLSGEYSTYSGTSFAAPNAAGLAALEMAHGRSLGVGGVVRYAQVNEEAVVAPSPTSTASTEQLEDNIFSEAKKVVAEALGADMNDIIISDLEIDGIWAFGIGVRPASGDGAPDLLLFIGKLQDNEWIITVEYTELYTDWLPLLPESLVSASYVEIYTTDLSGQGINEHQLSLPWATNETWALTGGPHSNDGSGNRPWNSLDFSGGSGVVRAAADGVVWRASWCPNFVRVDHANGWQTGYYHLINESVSNGQSVARGTAIGNTSNVAGCGGQSFGAHVHFSLRRHGSHVDVHNHDIGGWTVAETSHYNGRMTRIQNPSQVAVAHAGAPPSSWVTNYGEIGSGISQPGMPTITSPAQGANVTNPVSLTVQPGATNYTGAFDFHVQVARDAGFTQIVADNGGSWSHSTTMSLGNLQPGQYFVRVRQGDQVSQASDWTPPRSFVVVSPPGMPTITSPAQGANVTSPVSLTVQQGATNYTGVFDFHVQVALDAGFTQIVADNGNSWSQSPTMSLGNLPPGQYFVRVRQGDRVNQASNWTPPRSFVVVSPPGMPTITSPAQGANVTSPVSLTVQPGATNYTGVFDFHVQVALDAGFTQIVADNGNSWSQSPTMSLGNLPPGQYFVRVRQGDRVNQASNWTPPRSFVVVDPKPIAPANLNILRNGDFAQGVTHWERWGAIDWGLVNGAMAVNRTGNDGGITQALNYSSTAGMGFEVSFDVENVTQHSTGLRVGLYGSVAWEGDRSCVVSVPRHSPRRRYTMQVSALNWANLKLEIAIINNGQAIIDNITVRHVPALNNTQTVCRWQPAPANTNLILNGAFNNTNNWYAWGGLNYVIANGFAHMISKPANYAPLVQDIPYSVRANTPVEVTFRARNMSTTPKVLGVGINGAFTSGDYWQGGVLCATSTASFTLPSNPTWQTYTMRGVITRDLPHLRLQFDAAQEATDLDIQIDDVVVRVVPSLRLTETQCISPVVRVPAATAWGSVPTLTNDVRPTINWVANPNAAYYLINFWQEGASTTFSRVVPGVATSWRFDMDLSEGRWFVRIQAINSNSQAGPWNAARAIVIDTTPPAAPERVSPADGSSVATLTPRFCWLPVRDAVHYKVSWAVSLLDTTTATCYTLPYPLSVGQQWWTVIACDRAGNCSGWDSATSYQIVTPPNSAPRLVPHGRSATLTWTPVAYNHVGYQIEVYRHPNLAPANLVLTRNAESGASGVTVNLPPGTFWYRVRVQTSSAPVRYTPWSSVEMIIVR